MEATLNPAETLARLVAVLPPGAVVTDPAVLPSYSRDRELWAPSGTPLALVRATETAHVVEVMRWATEHAVPVVPRGAGSGLTGGANAIDGGLVLSLEQMDQILRLDQHDLCAVVQPGVLNAELRRVARTAGLMYAPDPGSSDFCTIGGNVATNAGGLCCLKYGVTRDAVLGLEIVLANGDVLRTGGRTMKDVAGLDLTSLFVGSEGQLGIATEVTVRLLPAPPTPATLIASFADLAHAGVAVHEIVRSGRPSMCEVMDQTTLRAVEAHRPSGLDLDSAALLLVQSDEADAATEITTFAKICEAAGATFTMATTDPVESEMLTMARRVALDALEAQGQWLLEDVCVPLSAVPELVAFCHEVGTRHDVLVACFGHAGDGNMHPTVVFPIGDTAAERRAEAAASDLVAKALTLGGTVTGEHGVGIAKRSKMEAQVGPVHLRVQRAVKQVLDPANILNPGKSLA